MEAETNSKTGPDRAEVSTPSAAVENLRQLLGDESTLAAARGISEEALDSIYGVARELYANGHHAEALRNLELLCLYDHENARYWHALGICRQVMQDYAGAVTALAFASGQVDEPDPGLQLNLAECLIACGSLDVAEHLLGDLGDDGDALDDEQRGKAGYLESRLTELRSET